MRLKRREFLRYSSSTFLFSGLSFLSTASEEFSFSRDIEMRMSRIENPLGPPNIEKSKVKDLSHPYHLYDSQDSELKNLKLAIRKKEDLNSDQSLNVSPGSSFFLEKIIKDLGPNYDFAVTLNLDYYKVIFLLHYYKLETKTIKYKKNLSVKDYHKKINGKRAFVYLSNPNQPVGHFFTSVELEWLVSKNPTSIFIVDEAYIEFYKNYEKHTSVGLTKKYKNVFISRTFSKIYGLASQRIGYFICHKIWNKNDFWGHFQEFTIGHHSIVCAKYSLSNHEYVNKSRDLSNRLRQDFYLKCLEKKVEYIGGHANYSLIRVSNKIKGNIKKYKFPVNNYFLDNHSLLRITHFDSNKYYNNLF